MVEDLVEAIAHSKSCDKLQAMLALLCAVRCWLGNGCEDNPEDILRDWWGLDADWELDFIYVAHDVSLDD